MTSNVSNQKIIKLLCLHGFKTSSSVMKFQLQWLRNTLLKEDNNKYQYHFEYLDAPHLVSKNNYEKSLLKYFKPPFYEWLNLQELNEKEIDGEAIGEPKLYSKGHLLTTTFYLSKELWTHSSSDHVSTPSSAHVSAPSSSHVSAPSSSNSFTLRFR